MTKIFAFYLPQFHPTLENDYWWGKGFTEWTNVTKAKPLFPGHIQPKLPADLGFYDLRVPEVLEEQAKLASSNGIDGFVFYHYWFGKGKVMLDKPIQQFLQNPKIDIQFCICWANESWKGTWHGANNRMLIEQQYLGKEDYINHFIYLLPFFKDPRCFQIDGKPVFQVYMPESIPDLEIFISTFNEEAKKYKLSGIYWLATKSSTNWDPKKIGFDGIINSNLTQINRYLSKSISGLILRYAFNNPLVRSIFKLPKTMYYHSIRSCLEDFREQYSVDFFPLAIPNWDNTPRAKNQGTVYLKTSPKAFGEHLKACICQALKLKKDRQIVFIKSWNEWAEGNYLEPDQKYGKEFLGEIISNLK